MSNYLQYGYFNFFFLLQPNFFLEINYQFYFDKDINYTKIKKFK